MRPKRVFRNHLKSARAAPPPATHQQNKPAMHGHKGVKLSDHYYVCVCERERAGTHVSVSLPLRESPSVLPPYGADGGVKDSWSLQQSPVSRSCFSYTWHGDLLLGENTLISRLLVYGSLFLTNITNTIAHLTIQTFFLHLRDHISVLSFSVFLIVIS